MKRVDSDYKNYSPRTAIKLPSIHRYDEVAKTAALIHLRAQACKLQYTRELLTSLKADHTKKALSDLIPKPA